MLREALEAAKGKKDKKAVYEKAVYEKSWRRLQKKDDEDKDFDAEEFVDTEARKMASAIMASVGRSLVTWAPPVNGKKRLRQSAFLVFARL